MRAFIIILQLLIAISLSSCSYFQYSYNKIIYKEEYNFVKSIIANPENSDSILLQSTYYDKFYFERYKKYFKMLKLLNVSETTYISGIYKNKNYRPVYNNDNEEMLSIEVNRSMKPGFQTIIFLFTKVKKQLILIDILWVYM